MQAKPKAIESYEKEKLSEVDSAFFEHPIERLKYHIGRTGGKIIKSEFAPDGVAYVIWESDGNKYNAWCSWPGHNPQIQWKVI